MIFDKPVSLDPRLGGRFRSVAATRLHPRFIGNVSPSQYLGFSRGSMIYMIQSGCSLYWLIP